MTQPLQFTCGPAILGGDGTLSLTLMVLADSDALSVSRGTGVPVSEDEIGSGDPTTLYLSFGTLVDGSTVPGIGLARIDGWQAQYFAAPEPAIAIYRDADGQLVPGASVSLSLTGVTPSAPTRVAKLGIDAYGVGPLGPASFTPAVPVQASTPGAALGDKVTLTVDPSNIVYVQQANAQPVTNRLTFQLAYPNPEPGATTLVPPGTPLPADMKITLSFLYSDPPGYDALTNATFSVNEGETYKDAWTASRDSSGNLLWELIPSPGILSPGGRVEFVITGLTTPLAAGETQMYVQYENIPGYADGFLSAPLVKEVPKPGILGLYPLVPTIAKLDSAVALAWSTFGVDRAELAWRQDGESRSVSTDNRAISFVESSYIPTQEIAEDITYRLTVWSGGVARDYREVSFQLAGTAPKVGEIVGTPGAVAAGQGFLLTAKVDNADTVTIKIDGVNGGPISLPVDADGIMRAQLVSADGASFTAAGGTGSIDIGPTPGLSPMFRFFATTSQGSNAQGTFQMTLLPPQISSFIAWLGQLDGDHQLMNWATSNAVKLIISPPDGLEDSWFNGPIGPDVTNVADRAATGPSGTRYSLTATGFGSVTTSEAIQEGYGPRYGPGDRAARVGAPIRGIDRGLRVTPDGLGVGGSAQLTAATGASRKYTLSIDGCQGSAKVAADAKGSLRAELTAPDANTIVLAGTPIALTNACATSVTLRVAPAGEPPSTVLLNLLPASVDSFDARPREGGGVELSWQTSNAASAQVTPDPGAGSSALSSDGVAASAGTYVLRAQGFGPPAGRLLRVIDESAPARSPSHGVAAHTAVGGRVSPDGREKPQVRGRRQRSLYVLKRFLAPVNRFIARLRS